MFKTGTSGVFSTVNRVIGTLGVVWGILGISLLLVGAIVRLSDIAWEIFAYPLQWYHWAILVLNVLFMAYSEGYKGFQLKFSPRFAARCRYLKQNPRIFHSLLAPLFCMGYFYTTRTRKIVTLVLTIAIIILVQLAHMLAQPWRGILDMGVVVGLAWGYLSILYYLKQAFTEQNFHYSPELPDST